MFRGSRIGLTAVLVAALIALGASPAYAGKKAGTITSGNEVILLNSSGFVNVTLRCLNSSIDLRFTAPGSLIDIWTQTFTGANTTLFHTTASGGGGSGTAPSKPAHVEWSVSQGTKVALGQVYAAGASGNANDCAYTSQVF